MKNFRIKSLYLDDKENFLKNFLNKQQNYYQVCMDRKVWKISFNSENYESLKRGKVYFSPDIKIIKKKIWNFSFCFLGKRQESLFERFLRETLKSISVANFYEVNFSSDFLVGLSYSINQVFPKEFLKKSSIINCILCFPFPFDCNCY